MIIIIISIITIRIGQSYLIILHWFTISQTVLLRKWTVLWNHLQLLWHLRVVLGSVWMQYLLYLAQGAWESAARIHHITTVTLPETNSKRQWKRMVARRLFPFGFRPIFTGKMVSFRGQLHDSTVTSHKIFSIESKQHPATPAVSYGGYPGCVTSYKKHESQDMTTTNGSWIPWKKRKKKNSFVLFELHQLSTEPVTWRVFYRENRFSWLGELGKWGAETYGWYSFEEHAWWWFVVCVAFMIIDDSLWFMIFTSAKITRLPKKLTGSPFPSTNESFYRPESSKKYNSIWCS